MPADTTPSTADYDGRSHNDEDSTFTISVTAALRDRRDEATPVIIAELKQMLDKHVFHGVHTRDLTKTQQSAIIRSSMFLKDKYLDSVHSKLSR